jgi:hypothetical protein
MPQLAQDTELAKFALKQLMQRQLEIGSTFSWRTSSRCAAHLQQLIRHARLCFLQATHTHLLPTW